MPLFQSTWNYNFQKKIHRPFHLRKDQITEVNTEEDLNRVLDEVEVAIERAGVNFWRASGPSPRGPRGHQARGQPGPGRRCCPRAPG